MDNILEDAAVETIMDLTSDDTMFTAFDVTKVMREAALQVPHHEMRKFVHKYFDDGGMAMSYRRTQTPVVCDDGKTRNVNLYHQVAADISEYDKDALGKAAVDPFGAMTDGRGRLCVPADIVRDAGLAVGDPIEIHSFPQQIVIRYDATDKDFIKDYTVDKSGNIRIGDKILRSNGLTGNRFSFKVVDDEIQIIRA